MNLMDIVRRANPPQPWSEGEKIPWNDPAFSQRMLAEHLTQEHDMASRRFEIIDRQVAWIHGLLAGKASRILDLGCGPGLYASRLARLGHSLTGIDFSPASIAYARSQAQEQSLSCKYVEGDVRQMEYSDGYQLAMFIFGEFNVFTRADARLILQKAHHALVPGGILVLEPHTFEMVEQIGKGQPSWAAFPHGLFSDQPHLMLNECFWDADQHISTERYYIIDTASGKVTRYAASMQAYHTEEYSSLITECGFTQVTFHAGLTGEAASTQPGLVGTTAIRG